LNILSFTMATDELASLVRARGVAPTILAAAATIFVLREAAPLLVTVFLSILVAYALEPFVSALIQLHLPRLAAAALIYLAIALVIGFSARAALNQLESFLDDVPVALASLADTITEQASSDDGRGALRRLQQAARELHETLTPRAAPPGVPPDEVIRVVPVRPTFDAHAHLLSLGRGAVSVVSRVFIVGLLAFLLLATGDLSKRKVMNFVGRQSNQRGVTIDVIRTIDRSIERYLVARVLISVIVATATGTGLWLLGMPHAIVWGLIAGVLNVLPIVGPTVAIVLTTLGAFLEFGTLETTLAAGAIATAIAVFEGNLVTPWLTSRAGELNTVAVFVSVLFWGWVWGMWGLLLAVPMMVAIKAAADRIDPFRPIGELLGR